MAGKYGVEASKKLLTVSKLGMISIIQGVAEDGFQPKDLVAFLKSETFLKQAADFADEAHLVLSEIGELDFLDGAALGYHAGKCADDLWTELKIAAKKIKERKERPKEIAA